MSYQNLVAVEGRPYLHNQKYTFYRGIQKLGISSLNKNNVTKGKLNKIIRGLEKQIRDAENRERQFFNDFEDGKGNRISSYGSISSCAIAWSQHYLLRDLNKVDTLSQKILGIINSPEMRTVLMGYTPDSKKFRNALSTALQKNQKELQIEGEKVLINAINDKIQKIKGDNFTIEKILQIAFFDSTGEKHSNIRARQQKLIEIFNKEMGINFNLDIKGAMKKPSGKNFQKILNEVNFRFSDIRNINIPRAKELMASELKRLGEDETTIKKVNIIWGRVLEQEYRAGENRTLLGREKNVTTGAQLEQGEFVAYIDYSQTLDDLTNKKLDAKLNGDTVINDNTALKKMAHRVGNEAKAISVDEKKVKGKVDTKYQGISGKLYNIQDKNTTEDIIHTFKNTEQLNQLTHNPRIKIQGGVSVPDLLKRMQTMGFITTSELKLLAYLIVNLNVLNKFASDKLKKRRALKDDSGNFSGSAESGIQKLISQIFSSGVQYFMTSELEDNKTEQYMFIIYAGRFLIPVSIILEELKKSIIEESNRIIRLQVYTELQGSNSAYNAMFAPKNKAREEEQKKDKSGTGKKGGLKYSYENSDLVEAGRTGGEAYYTNQLKIHNIYFNLDVKNAVAKALF